MVALAINHKANYVYYFSKGATGKKKSSGVFVCLFLLLCFVLDKNKSLIIMSVGVLAINQI